MNARRFLLALLFAAAALPLFAASQDRAYVVSLDPAAAIDRTAALGADLAAAYGGSLQSSKSPTDDTVIIRMTPSQARALASDPRVKSVLPQRTRANAVIEPVVWSAGIPLSYDGAGQPSQIGADDFLYDDAGRLVRAKVNGATRSYEYDAFGNRSNCSQTSPSAACQFGYGTDKNTNHLTGSVSYDPQGSGNVTILGPHTYTYDAVNMMKTDKVGTAAPSEFVYTAEDERIATNTGGFWKWTVRDLDNRVLREFTSTDGGAFVWTKDYVWRNSSLLASRQPDVDNTVTTYHYHLDHLNTPRRITDGSDEIIAYHDYYAFGPEVSGGLRETSRTDIKYTSHERDSEDEPYGLDYMHARYYDPSLGRFLSIDPVAGKAASPQSWNRYAYARNSPMAYVDPTGEDVVLTGTDERAKAELAGIQDSLMNADAASRLYITTGDEGQRLLGIRGDVDEFARLTGWNGPAKTIAEAVRANANIYFYLGAMQYNSGPNAPAYTQAVNLALEKDESSHHSYVAINPAGLPLRTRGGSYENLSSVIQHELGHAIALANGWRGGALLGPRAGTNPFAIEYENDARRWYGQVTGDSKKWELRSKEDHGW